MSSAECSQNFSLKMADDSLVPQNLIIDRKTGALSIAVGASKATLQFSIVIETQRSANASIHRLSVDGFTVNLICGPQSTAITLMDPLT